MVFFFIAYLIIIILFCFPFKLRIVVFLSNIPKLTYFYIKIGFFHFLKDFSKILKKKKKKKSINNIKIKLKRITLKKPISYHSELFINRPAQFVIFEKLLIGTNLEKLAKFTNAKLPDTYFFIEDNNSRALKFHFDIKIKINFLLIILSLVQTLKIERK